MTKMDGRTPDIAEENIERLKQLFPEVCCEDKVDFDKLKQVLGDYVDDDTERYNFTWNGKGRALKLSQTPSTGTLRPCKEESKNWEDTENLYIEGDNLEVLKLLQKSYYGKIKMIYIDPPYNTGNDFVYKDSFKDGIDNYKEITGQIDSEGKNIGTNSETSGRYHTDWLNMMYPRLRLARNFLSGDGVILISIDEHEYSNLKQICDEVFGESNYFGDIIWESTTQPINAGSAKFGLQKKTEPILLYAKNKAKVPGFVIKEVENNFTYPHIGKYGACRFEIIEKSDAGSYNRETMKYKILGQYPRKGKRWQLGEDTARLLEKEGKVEIVDGIVKKAVYPEDEVDRKQFKPFWSLLSAEECGTAQTGKDELNSIMGTPIGFDTVKSIALVKTLLFHLGRNYTVMDFFSGSGTTADALMQLNAEDGGNRKYIMIQLPEETNEKSEAHKAGYKNICEIGKERIRRAGEKIKTEIEEENKQVKMGEEPKKIPDIGFKVFKLDSSNIKKWQPEEERIEETLLTSIENFVPDRTELDVVYEIMVKLGIDLTYPVEGKGVDGKKIYSIGMGSLMICLDDDVTTDIADEMIKLHEEMQPEVWKVVFKDNGFKDDSVKINIFEIFKSAGLEEDAFTTI